MHDSGWGLTARLSRSSLTSVYRTFRKKVTPECDSGKRQEDSRIVSGAPRSGAAWDPPGGSRGDNCREPPSPGHRSEPGNPGLRAAGAPRESRSPVTMPPNRNSVVSTRTTAKLNVHWEGRSRFRIRFTVYEFGPSHPL